MKTKKKIVIQYEYHWRRRSLKSVKMTTLWFLEAIFLSNCGLWNRLTINIFVLQQINSMKYITAFKCKNTLIMILVFFDIDTVYRLKLCYSFILCHRSFKYFVIFGCIWKIKCKSQSQCTKQNRRWNCDKIHNAISLNDACLCLFAIFNTKTECVSIEVKENFIHTHNTHIRILTQNGNLELKECVIKIVVVVIFVGF